MKFKTFDTSKHTYTSSITYNCKIQNGQEIFIRTYSLKY